MHACRCAHTHTHTHTHTCTQMYTYTHTHTHALQEGNKKSFCHLLKFGSLHLQSICYWNISAVDISHFSFHWVSDQSIRRHTDVLSFQQHGGNELDKEWWCGHSCIIHIAPYKYHSHKSTSNWITLISPTTAIWMHTVAGTQDSCC